MALNLTGVISKGILKLKLAFDSSVSIPERVEIMKGYAKGFSTTGEVKVIETTHFAGGSSMKAQI